MSKQLRFSRWRRLTGWHRITEKKLPTYRTEAQRLTLYIPGAVLDLAEQLALRRGTSNLQAFCERMLIAAVEAESIREQLSAQAAAEEAFETIDDIACDVETIAEWSAATTVPISLPEAIDVTSPSSKSPPTAESRDGSFDENADDAIVGTA